MSPPHLAITLSGVPAAVSEARAVMRTWLTARACSQDSIDSMELLVTEVVTNAVRHTDSEVVSVTAARSSLDVIRVEVEDCSPTPPRSPPAVVPPNSPGGRGLWLVQRISEAWGWERVPGGKLVWFELSCPVIPKSRHSW